ncbi:hypothetical protein ACE3G8_06590 [Vreelandella venusta]
MTDVEKRIAELERRVEILEATRSSESSGTSAPPPTAKALIAVEVKNKRYDPENSALGKYEDHIWFDCYYTLSADSKPTRAVKGVLEFGDLFGEVKFRLNTTLNMPLNPSNTTAQEGIGFNYNQFMEEHQWMLGTALNDMTVNFRVLNAIYEDGSSESFA